MKRAELVEPNHPHLRIMDWHSKKVLGWAVSNTMDAALCQRALRLAVEQSERLPGIFNTDQGSQFTSQEMDDRVERTRDRNQHGWERPVDGQRVCRTALAEREV